MTDEEARAFATTYRSFLEWVHHAGSGGRTNDVVQLVQDHLGEAGREHSVVVANLAPFDQVNLQVALDAWSSRPGRRMVVRGITTPPHFGAISLQQLTHGDGLPPVRLSAPDLVDLPVGPDRSMACLRRALLLVEDERGRWVLFLRGPEPHEDPGLSLEVAGLPSSDAQAVLRELADLRRELNIYRGQVLDVGIGPTGLQLTFPVLPTTRRDDVVLPEAVLHRIERHTIDVAGHRAGLRSAGQHLKRGLLLHGPPGTGKTHTTRYVIQQLAGSTVFMLTGMSLQAVGPVTGLARELEPAIVVLEDVDLVAEERSHGPMSNPVLFELLDAMDGAAADADLLFLLTTNRADLLEPALASRPGRVDVAVEIGLPDDDARHRLLDLYLRGVPTEATSEAVDDAVGRTAGVTASFIKELVRRAVLESLADSDGQPAVVSDAHLDRALDDLLDSSQAVTRALLGVPADQVGPPDAPSPGGRWGRSSWPGPMPFGPSAAVITLRDGD